MTTSIQEKTTNLVFRLNSLKDRVRTTKKTLRNRTKIATADGKGGETTQIPEAPSWDLLAQSSSSVPAPVHLYLGVFACRATFYKHGQRQCTQNKKTSSPCDNQKCQLRLAKCQTPGLTSLPRRRPRQSYEHSGRGKKTRVSHLLCRSQA